MDDRVARASRVLVSASRRNDLSLDTSTHFAGDAKEKFATRESFRSRQLATGRVRPTGGHARRVRYPRRNAGYFT